MGSIHVRSIREQQIGTLNASFFCPVPKKSPRKKDLIACMRPPQKNGAQRLVRVKDGVWPASLSSYPRRG